MSQHFGRFLAASIFLHSMAMALSTLFFAASPVNTATTPIKVDIIYAEAPKNEDLPEGRIEDLPKPSMTEKPDQAKILSRHDSKAHSPEKGHQYQASRTAIPREAVELPPPSLKKSDEDQPEKRKAAPTTEVSALQRPTLDLTRNEQAREINLFSADMIKKALEADKDKKFEKAEIENEEKRRQTSSQMADKTVASTTEPKKIAGIKGFKGSDLEKFAMSSTSDVIDMGDEAIVSLNTMEFQYVDYFNSIKKAIELVWRYPDEAVIHGLSGALSLRFTLKDTGELEDVKLIRSSRHKPLDDEALLAVKVAAPYNAFPASLAKKRLHIVATFIYQPTFNAIR
jgi:TonB family protein